jgi:drug/metabolite transporter (DMT)-like permease
MSVNPLFTMILAYFVLKESLNKRKIGGFLLGLIGIVFMIRPWNLQEGNTLLGAMLMLLAAITFGLYTVMGKIRLEKIGLFRQTCISFLMGSGVLLIFILLMERPILAGVVENIWLVLYIGVFVTGLGYYFYFMAIKYAGATTASIAFFIKPAMAPLFAVILLKDVILWNTYVGIGCILAASFISLMNGIKLKKYR